MMRFLLKTTAISMLTLGLCAIAAAAQTQSRVQFKQYTLKNGLRVILSEDHAAPVIALHIAYDVGSRNERPGRTGFAHLFEHMMFKGSQNVGSGEHFYLINVNGGNMNGTTSTDRTVYFETLPANQLEMGLFLEADRMRSLAITQENLDNQRNAVQEERRQSYDNQPYGRAYEALEELLYDNFAYKHSTIGSMADLNAATVEDVSNFFKTYYAPNNAVLSLVGDFKSSKALASIKRHFESIPRQTMPPLPDMQEPDQTTERRTSLDDKLARLSQVRIAYKTVPSNTPDFYALQVLASVLQTGRSSRLYRSLVVEKQLSPNIGAFNDERRGRGAFYLIANVMPGKEPTAIETALNAEVERVQTQPIADWELEKAINNARVGYLNGLRSAQARAAALGIYAVFYNDPNLVNTRLEKLRAVTRADVQRVAKQYLQPSKRAVLTILAKAGAPSR